MYSANLVYPEALSCYIMYRNLERAGALRGEILCPFPDFPLASSPDVALVLHKFHSILGAGLGKTSSILGPFYSPASSFL